MASGKLSKSGCSRLRLIKQTIGQRRIVCALMKVEMSKKEKTTDYVAKQYIGNIGQTANGIVSVNAYAVVDKLTYPLLFKICKPNHGSSRRRPETNRSLPSRNSTGSQSIRLPEVGWFCRTVCRAKVLSEPSNIPELVYIVTIHSSRF